jgi:preprotein translocase subunit SecE
METVQQGGHALVAGGGLGGWLRRAGAFLSAVRAEMKKVSWPTRDELVTATRMILIMSVVLGLLIGWMDLLLQLILVDGVARLAR